jgi:hypothetical protein
VGFELHVPMLWFKGENTFHLSKIVVTKIEILHLVFLGTCGHHISDYFCSFQIYHINFRLKLFFNKKTPIKFYKFEHMHRKNTRCQV